MTNSRPPNSENPASSPVTSPSTGILTPALTLLMSVATGLIVANLYYIQPLMGEIARGFQVPQSTVGLAVTLAQAGSAIGTLTVLPLGDVTDRRRLITMSCVLAACSLLVMALSPNPLVFLAGNLALGITSTATHLQVSYAAHLADPARRGRAVGAVMSGLLIGILIARTVSGYAGMWIHWRTILLIAASITLGLGGLLRLKLPQDTEIHKIRYLDLLRSIPRLVLNLSTLRDCCIYGALTFAAFNAFWATLTFHLEAPPFEMTTRGIGLISLVAVAGALAANGTGHLAAFVRPIKIIFLSLVITLVSFGVFYIGGFTISGMLIGIILMDLGIQATHISSQTVIHSLMPQARNRIHCVYMVSYFLGGAMGSAAGTWGYAQWGWSGLCWVGAAFTAVALLYWFLRRGGRADAGLICPDVNLADSQAKK